MDGSDLAQVNRSAKKLLSITREKSRPSLLKIDVFRAHEHCGPDQDSHLSYRSVKGHWPKMDPIKKSKDFIGKKMFQAINEETKMGVENLLKARQISLA